MPGIAAVPTKFTALKRGDASLFTALSRIKARGHGQVVVLGLGVAAFYRNEGLAPAILGADWATFVSPPPTTWDDTLTALEQFSALIEEDATQPRVGFIIAPAEYVREHLFRPSKTGPYEASIYWLGLQQQPLRCMDVLGQLLSRSHIRSPWLECIFSADDLELRIWEQEKLNHKITAGDDHDEFVSVILHSIEAETNHWITGRCGCNAQEAAGKSQQCWN